MILLFWTYATVPVSYGTPLSPPRNQAVGSLYVDFLAFQSLAVRFAGAARWVARGPVRAVASFATVCTCLLSESQLASDTENINPTL